MSDGCSDPDRQGDSFSPGGREGQQCTICNDKKAFTMQWSAIQGIIYIFQAQTGRASFPQEGEGGGQGQHVCYLAVKIEKYSIHNAMKCNSWDCVLVPTLDNCSDSDGLFFTTGGIEEGQHVCYLAVCPVLIPTLSPIPCLCSDQTLYPSLGFSWGLLSLSTQSIVHL